MHAGPREDDLVCVWSMQRQAVVARGQGHGSWVNAVAWEPYHVSRGYNRGDSVVTVVALHSGPNQVTDFRTRDSLGLCDMLAATLAVTYDKYMPQVNDCLVVVCPEHYRTLHRGGVASKPQLQAALTKVALKRYRKLAWDKTQPWRGALVRRDERRRGSQTPQ